MLGKVLRGYHSETSPGIARHALGGVYRAPQEEAHRHDGAQSVFKQTRLEAFFEKWVSMEGRHRILCVEKEIVDVVKNSRLTLLLIR